MEHLLKFWHEVVTTFLDMAPYLLLGLTFAGILHVVFTKEFVIKHLGKNNLLSIIKAAILGVPLPLCSCGVLPMAFSLRKSKASKGAILSFLISTPQTGIDSIVPTYGMLGPVFAVFRPVAALIMGIIGGICAIFVSRSEKEPVEETAGPDFSCNICIETDPHIHSIIEKVRSMALYAYKDFLDDISMQLLIGMLIASLISFAVPGDFFTRYVGNEFVSMLMMVAIGIPMYVCATASIPIAAALMLKGLSPGAAFVFLCVGPATNAATVLLVSKILGKKILVVYLGTLSILSIVAGYVLNAAVALFGGRGSLPAACTNHSMTNESTSPIVLISSLFFLILLILSMYRIFADKFLQKKKVCTHCVNNQ